MKLLSQVPIDLFPISNGALSPDPSQFAGRVVTILVGLGGVVALILVVMGGYKFLTSGGDASKIKDGKDQIQNALLGFMLILISVSVTVMIFYTFGLDNSLVNFN